MTLEGLTPDQIDLSALAPTGVVRVGVVVAPVAGVFFAAAGPGPGADDLVGVTPALGRALAARLGVGLELVAFPNSGECTDAVAAGAVDVAFMPVDAARAARVAFGPAYYLLESTYLVTAESGIGSLAEVDRPGVRVVGIADTTTIRASGRSLGQVQPVACRGVDAAIAMLREERADALALSRDSLNQIRRQIAGSRVLDGGFQQTTISIAVTPGRAGALAAAAAFLEAAKRDGTVRRAMDALGLVDEAVAP